MKKWYEEEMGSHERQRLKSRVVKGHGGHRGGKPARESRQLVKEVLIQGEGVTAHICKIGLKGRLARQARG